MKSCTAFLIGFVPPDTFLATARVIRPVLIGFWLCASVSPPLRHLCFGQCPTVHVYTHASIDSVISVDFVVSVDRYAFVNLLAFVDLPVLVDSSVPRVRRARGPVVFSDLERPKLRSSAIRSTPFEPSSEVAMLDLLLAFWSCTAFLIGFVPPDTFLATARVIRPVLIGFWLCASVSPPVRHLCFGQCESSCLAPMLRLG
ncbi:hypothetical protein GQ457_10G004260 [Hibiscus cannabinus]